MLDAAMRTTLDIDDDVLQAAKEIAANRRSTTGKVISDLARRGLAPPKEKVRVKNGVLLLGPRTPDDPPVTVEFVNQLKDEEP
jgi:hypothetical protein